MSRLRFMALGHDHQICEAFGRHFPHGAWVDASDMAPEHLATLSQNPAFEADPDPEEGSNEVRSASRRQDRGPAKEA